MRKYRGDNYDFGMGCKGKSCGSFQFAGISWKDHTGCNRILWDIYITDRTNHQIKHEASGFISGVSNDRHVMVTWIISGFMVCCG